MIYGAGLFGMGTSGELDSKEIKGDVQITNSCPLDAIASTTIHEIMHNLGYKHTIGMSIMNSGITEKYMFSRDVRGINILYPSADKTEKAISFEDIKNDARYISKFIPSIVVNAGLIEASLIGLASVVNLISIRNKGNKTNYQNLIVPPNYFKENPIVINIESKNFNRNEMENIIKAVKTLNKNIAGVDFKLKIDSKNGSNFLFKKDNMLKPAYDSIIKDNKCEDKIIDKEITLGEFKNKKYYYFSVLSNVLRTLGLNADKDIFSYAHNAKFFFDDETLSFSDMEKLDKLYPVKPKILENNEQIN